MKIMYIQKKKRVAVVKISDSHLNVRNNTPPMETAIRITTIAAFICCLNSCIAYKIGSNTTGRQLIELKEALDKGAISQKEYKTQREWILSAESR
jgi:hypothetical protein